MQPCSTSAPIMALVMPIIIAASMISTLCCMMSKGSKSDALSVVSFASFMFVCLSVMQIVTLIMSAYFASTCTDTSRTLWIIVCVLMCCSCLCTMFSGSVRDTEAKAKNDVK